MVRKEESEALDELGRRCRGRVISTVVGGFKCGGVVRIPGLSGIMVGVNINRTGSGTGLLRSTVTSVRGVTKRGTIMAETGGSMTGFGVERNVPVKYGIALEKRGVCRFISHLVGLSLPHMHSFEKMGPGTFSKENGCTLKVGRRLVFPRVRCSGVSGIENVSMVFIAATGASRRTHRLLARFGVPFTGWGKRGFVTGASVGVGRRHTPGFSAERCDHYEVYNHPRTCLEGCNVYHVYFHRLTCGKRVPNIGGTD